jgi:hypothetical protein
MAKIALTLTRDYCAHWGLAEALRELGQNVVDGETAGYPGNVSWVKSSGTVRFTNEGVTLPREALLLGFTTKRNREEMAGQFGEGFKLACLVLARSGVPIKIRNGGEVWVPSMEKDDKFGGVEVLTFDIQTGRADTPRVQVEVGAVNEESWAMLQGMFLFARKGEVRRVKTRKGDVLTDPEFQGQVFVKGIRVTQMPTLQYGYDLRDVAINRDRTVIDGWDLQCRLRDVWAEACEADPKMGASFYEMLAADAEDVKGIADWSAGYIPNEVRKDLAARFVETHGEGAIPVNTLAESKDIEHLGAKGVVVPKPLAAVLATIVGSTDTVKKNLANSVVATFGWSDLTDAEKANLERAISMCNWSKHGQVSLDSIDVVTFRDDGLLGQLKDGRILLARRNLRYLRDTLATLVHEVAHDNGGDGDKGHVATIEEIWADIVEHMTKE